MKHPRRIAVLDVGCFSAHLVVVGPGAQALRRPVLSHKVRLRLDRALDADGRIRAAGIDGIAEAVAQVKRRLDKVRASAFLPYATSCVRDATNADEVIDAVARRTGITLRLLSGKQEARMSYLAVRRWHGSGRPLTVLDVGGGTIELAVGDRAKPLFAGSLPLGARTLTRAGLDRLDRVPEMRAELLRRITAAVPDDVLATSANSPAIGCSKVFQGLATLTGSRPGQLRVDDLRRWIPRLAELSPRQRAKLPGISAHRARQSFAGAVVAEALMTATQHDVIEVCPWSSKEGLLLDLLK
ncbi:Ppx/GppA phosphatase family protein [Labedaea rhizosphaerae]|uniref:Exopolyphosphatase/guanosine-5'-triphosphate, 3'-diphosphate pyrophosphatase n=1 Tax=Labedaea rhizosphaerae TaxID=598644 RepID=A0A4R6SFY9_LABRH|nr:exopolyphosphatase [Labedaea rhizosphaerae]TDQ00266.1 exopolyphosphatase/guanosine-5'-triphosphate,3'-diphosphate pyrophosphatase [Labedaea rhizosphaerae]